MMVTLVTVLCSEGGPIILIFIIRVLTRFFGGRYEPQGRQSIDPIYPIHPNIEAQTHNSLIILIF